jgi:hypothetical protein
MPGWGDDINLVRYLKVVLSYILEQRAKVGRETGVQVEGGGRGVGGRGGGATSCEGVLLPQGGAVEHTNSKGRGGDTCRCSFGMWGLNKGCGYGLGMNHVMLLHG